jgi:hypothetical protein
MTTNGGVALAFIASYGSPVDFAAWSFPSPDPVGFALPTLEMDKE